MKHKYSSKADFVRKNKKKAQTDVKSNPFEVRINRQKHTVLGKKLRKFDKGMPGVSRSKAIKKRKATLLQEYQQRDKRNQFVDRRLGENDPEMTLEDKMLQRFAMERKTHHEKASAFSLNEEEELTHFGQSLSQIEKFEEPDSDSDDDATGKLSGEYVKEAHFGGFLTKKTAKDNEEEKSDKPKSRQEMIEEIIAQSKQRKHERQHQKEQTDDLREKLDQQWTELQNHMLVQKKSKSQPKEEREKPKADDYDIMVRELGFEIKAKASDRLKTEEELAREEQERLQKLEADRQLRMKGLTQEDIRQQQQNRHVSADDLDDGFDFIRPERLQLAYKDGKLLLPEGKELMPSTSDAEDKPIRKKPHSEAAADQSEDEDKEDQSEEENSDQSEGEDSDQSEEEDEDDGSDLESEKSEEDILPLIDFDQDVSHKFCQERKAIAEAAKTELPYTFKAPESLKDLMELMEGQSYDRQLIIIHRIRKCHHPSLAEGNKKKLQDLFSILLEYFGKLANQSPVATEMIDGLTIHLYELAQQSTGPAAESVQTVLKNKYHKFDSVCQRKGRAVYPAVDTLLLLKLVSVIFPTSDFRHSVVTPAMLFMAQILTKCPVTSGRDVACASVAEVVPPFKHAGAEGSLLVLQGSDSRSINIEPLALNYLSKNPTQDTDTDDFRICATHATLQLTNKFANMYKNLPAFHETFSPIRDLLSKHLVLDACPQEVQAARSQFLQLMTDHHSQATYPPLQYEKLKPKPLKLYEPKFDEDYNPERKMKGSRKQKEKERLQKMHKRELKGAVREIRKDAQFLARQQLQEQMDKDAERKRKVKEIMHHLSSQEGECKQIAKKKIKIM
ncbi:nucleolar complex protein 14 [Branchiostoma belcheri]|nr:nucleolar complex protein 14 [Branchiostoma belcheri]